MATLGFKDNDGLDVGNKYVTKEYIIDRYPNIATHSNMPSLWTWGGNPNGSYGFLGDNTATAKRSSPGSVFAGASNWRVVDCSGSSVIAVRTDGTLWTWGINTKGNLGSGNTSNRSSPGSTIGGGTNWVTCSTSKNNQGTEIFSAAIKNDGTLWTWGPNPTGQLGDGATTASRSSPGTVAGGGTNWKTISCGSRYALAIKTDGTLWSWGGNSNGNLGSGNTTNRSSPVTVIGGLTNWIRAYAGYYVSAGITNDGILWTWGENSLGQLGDGSTTNRFSPGTVAGGGTNWKAFSCGYYSAAAIKTDGSLWTWGANNTGQLGDGSTTNRFSPGTVAGAGLNWAKVSIGGGGAAIKTDGSLWTWGTNNQGNLADGSTTDRSSPATTALSVNSWKYVSVGGFIAAGIKEEDDW